MKVSLVLVLTVALLVFDVRCSPIPGFGGLPDLANMGHGFGAKISNIIKGNMNDGLERAFRKISLNGRKASSSSSESSDEDSDEDTDSSLFGFSGKQFEQLIQMLQDSQTGAANQQQAAPSGAVPFAAIDNSVD